MKSEWIMDMGEVWICRNCGEPCKEHFMGKPRWNYCPWCGADMRAEQTEPSTERAETMSCQECKHWLMKGGYECKGNVDSCKFEPIDNTDCSWK